MADLAADRRSAVRLIAYRGLPDFGGERELIRC
jgi:hypothetical protein